MRYINEFIRLKCSADMLLLKLFPNTKEITESLGAYSAVRDHCDFDFADEGVTVVCAGDGHMPRTAATFALRSKWNAISIDPKLRQKKVFDEVERLTCISKRVEEVDEIVTDKLVIAAVHSHAPLQATLDKCVFNQAFVVTIPCCVPQELHNSPDIEYVDESILSAKNTVQCWKISDFR